MCCKARATALNNVHFIGGALSLLAQSEMTPGTETVQAESLQEDLEKTWQLILEDDDITPINTLLKCWALFLDMDLKNLSRWPKLWIPMVVWFYTPAQRNYVSSSRMRYTVTALILGWNSQSDR